jgi:hypothetical protein
MDKKVLSEIKRSLHKGEFIVLPFRVIRPGTVFMPIERMGRGVYRKKKGFLHKERAWVKTPELFVKASNALSRSLHSDKDAIFSLFDWCIVRRTS